LETGSDDKTASLWDVVEKQTDFTALPGTPEHPSLEQRLFAEWQKIDGETVKAFIEKGARLEAVSEVLTHS